MFFIGINFVLFFEKKFESEAVRPLEGLEEKGNINSAF
jgi:hypothetical protein